MKIRLNCVRLNPHTNGLEISSTTVLEYSTEVFKKESSLVHKCYRSDYEEYTWNENTEAECGV